MTVGCCDEYARASSHFPRFHGIEAMPTPTRTTMNESLDLRGEIGRKALHLLSLALPAGMIFLPYAPTLVALVLLSVVAMAAEVARDRSAAVHAWIDRWLGWMMRPDERKPGSGFCGATWVVVTAALLLAAFEPFVAALALTIGLVGDAAAALVGRTVGRISLGRTGRTLEGSLAFVLTGIGVAALAGGFAWPVRMAAVLGAALVEALPLPVNDNLAVPFAAALALSLL